jgi:hypothetical protein
VIFLDADDEMLDGCIGERITQLERLSTDYFGVYGSAIRSDGRNLRYIDFDGVPAPGDVGHFETGLPGGACLYLFRTSSLREIGGFDEDLRNNEDFDLLLRLARKGLRCKGCLRPGTLVHVRPGSVSRGSDPRKVFQQAWRFLEKAELNAYFPTSELRSRQKAAYLTLARQLFAQHPRQSCEALRAGFAHARPQRVKEWAAYLITRLF